LISEKFDIFSLGIIILKIVAGKRGYSKYRGMNSEQFADDVRNSIVFVFNSINVSIYMEIYKLHMQCFLTVYISVLSGTTHLEE